MGKAQSLKLNCKLKCFNLSGTEKGGVIVLSLHPLKIATIVLTLVYGGVVILHSPDLGRTTLALAQFGGDRIQNFLGTLFP